VSSPKDIHQVKGITLTYLEELILSSLESDALLTVVHEHGGIVNDRHLGETLLGVQQHVQN
jgi:hypothetical protein